MRELSPLGLGVAVIPLLGASLVALLRRRGGLPVAVAVLWAVVAVAGVTQLRLAGASGRWEETRQRIEDEAAGELRGELDALVDAGEEAVEAALVAVRRARDDRGRLFRLLDGAARARGLSAVAVYAADGRPIAWTGEHRGRVPDEVRLGAESYLFQHGPLLRYLYFVRPVGDGRTVVVAALLDSELQLPGPAPFSSRFEREHWVRPRFTAPERAEGESVWDWTTDDRSILSVSFVTPSPEEQLERVAAGGRRAAAGLAIIAALLLLAGWYRGGHRPRWLPVPVLTASFLFAPLGELLGARELFSPLRFLLPLPVDVTLGDLLVLAAGGAVGLLATARTPHPGGGWRGRALGAVGVGISLPAVLWLILDGASVAALAAYPAGGLLLVLAGVVLAALPLALFAVPPERTLPRRTRLRFATGAAALAAGLGIAVAFSWSPGGEPKLWTASLWAAPFLVFLPALGSGRGRGLPLAAWLAAGWLAATVVPAHLWTAHLSARASEAEAELARLGLEPDPYLDFLLRNFAGEAARLDQEGEEGIRLLYRGWEQSGFTGAGYEARLTLWDEGQPVDEIRFGEAQLPRDLFPSVVEEAATRGSSILRRYTGYETVHYLLLIPLGGERVVSVVVPPQYRLAAGTSLAGMLYGAEDESGVALGPLRLIPAVSATGHEGVRWLRTEEGWRAETDVRFPRGPVHAHLEVPTPTRFLLLARGSLLATLSLSLLLLLYLAGRLLAGGWAGWGGVLTRLRSFRGRLTLALLIFFLLPVAAFGAVAYQALSREVIRAASALASRSLEQAAGEASAGSLPELGERLYSDLLLYRLGVLVEASSPEVIDLGLYQSWIPPGVYLRFVSGDEVEDSQEGKIGESRYLVAYRRIGPGEILAAPTPLDAGEISRRRREFAHTLLFFGLAGAALSVVLSLLVGRALSRPIERLSRAAAAVGEGNLRVRLPEGRRDEFASLVDSFNRMVVRLRQARAAEVESARVLAWGEMARQVAHEIKNPLTPIQLAVQHVRRAYRDRRPDFGAILERNVAAVLKEIDQLGEIARGFSRFGAPSAAAGELVPVELRAVVNETLALYRGGGGGVRYRARLDEAVSTVYARAGELKEVLLNLIENARAAGDGRGEIEVVARVAGGGWVELAVSDHGEGVAPDQLSRIFEPQFSTRSSGTGLGLAIVRRLVESWGGRVAAESEPGRGTTVRVRMRAG